jgi:dipeptidyl aminopeptidase/acylaminoacyl peptidase
MGEDRAALEAASPTTLAAAIKVPVLLVHGTKDKVAPIVHGEMMRDALAKAGHPAEWMEVPDEGHGFYDSERRKQYYLKIEAFLARHLGN